jgi:uncharacterized protein YukE
VTTIVEQLHPQDYLKTPQSQGAGTGIVQLRMSLGPVLGGVDWIVERACGFSPIAEWVVKPFGGDWDAFDKAGAAWSNAAEAVRAIADNVAGVPPQVAGEWGGEASEAWANAHQALAQFFQQLPEQFESLAEVTEKLAEFAREILKMISEMLRWIAETAIAIAFEILIPIVGQIAAGAQIVVLGVRISVQGGRIVLVIKDFFEFAKAIISLIQRIEAFIKILAPVIEAYQAADRALDAV